MCGIVYAKSLTGSNVNKKIWKRYKAQRSRGTSGFGFYMPEFDRLTHNVNESGIKRELMRRKTSEVLFHHRFPTSTANVQSACHPFSTKWEGFGDRQYILVHNGVLWNDDELYEEHAKLGIKYVSEQPNGAYNDSEALLYDVALTLSGQQEKMKAEGAIAFICYELDDQHNVLYLHFGRNEGNPLKMNYVEGRSLVLASEGSGVDIKPDTLYTYDLKRDYMTEAYFEIPEYSYTPAYSYTRPYEDDDYGWVNINGKAMPLKQAATHGSSELDAWFLETSEGVVKEAHALIETLGEDLNDALGMVCEDAIDYEQATQVYEAKLAEADALGDIDAVRECEEELDYLAHKTLIYDVAYRLLETALINQATKEGTKKLLDGVGGAA